MIILEGASSSGKTSVINELVKIYGDTYEVVSIDNFESSFDQSKKELGNEYLQVLTDSFYSLITEKASKGYNLLVDTVPTVESDIEKNLDAVRILLYCPLGVTLDRVEQRNRTGISKEYRYPVQPVGHYLSLYKSQEVDSEHIVDTVTSENMKQHVKGAIDSFLSALPDEFKGREDEVAKSYKNGYQEFVQHFKLDTLEEVVIVPKKSYDLVLDCRHAPQELAQQIVEFLGKKSVGSGRNNIKTIYSYHDIIEQSHTWCDNTYIFFDVDDTIIYGPELFPNSRIMQWLFRIRMVMRYPWLMYSSYWEEYYSLMWDQAERFLVDSMLPTIIEQWQKGGVTVLGLTSMETGAYGIINDMPEWRLDMLKKLGIEFSALFEDITFNDFKPYRGNYPQLRRGLLCTNQQKKSEVLKSFIDYYNVQPTNVVHFDDSLDVLQETADFCEKRKISYHGYHYIGSPGLHYRWSMERALLQLDFLVKDRKWLSDKEADALLQLG